MKKPPLRHKAKKNVRTGLSLALCVLLTLCFYAAPVRGAEPESAPPAEETRLEEPEKAALPEEPAEAGLAEEPEAPEDPEASGGNPEEKPETVTLTFRMGSFGTRTLEVEKGQYPSGLPEIPSLPAADLLGWYDQQGQPAHPENYPAEADAVYTARWSRQVDSLLNTDEHFAYIHGYSKGMFKPGNGVTRAEAAQMFYSLLRDQSWEKKTFSDVPADKWYADAIGTMAGLGILSGYTDGAFRPNRQITRAEFVTMAAACDTLENGGASFSDVPASSWAAQSIASASAKGWVDGFQDGTFRPKDKITRAQAVTILNQMLGRSPDPDVKGKDGVKNFYDVYPTSWAYGQILEASTSHSYTQYSSEEVWTDYQRDDSPAPKTGWVTDGSTRYYLDGKTGKFLRGEQTINGKKYLLDASTGAAVTGFRNVGSWRRYYRNGLPVEDISGLGVVKGPYFIKVYKNSNYLIIFAKDDKGNYNTPVRAMRVSCGFGTPVGTFYTPDRYRWLKMVGDTWAQWCTQIQGNYLFHSVPCWTQNNADLEVDEYNHLGETRSLGCIRLNCRDAKWIFDNCQLGTKVTITTWEASGPLSKPAGIQIPTWHTWDPTDPTAYWRCQQSGCH